MTVRTFVGFVADFPSQRKEDEPPGRELAQFIYASLVRAGFNTTRPENRGDYAWDMVTRQDGLEIVTIVGLVGDLESDPPRQWLITNDCHIPFFRKLLGQGQEWRARRERLLRRFCEAIHQSMSDDRRFSAIYWYWADTFDQAGDQPGEEP